MWTVILTDGSKVSALEHEEIGLPQNANRRSWLGQSMRVLFELQTDDSNSLEGTHEFDRLRSETTRADRDGQHH